MSKSLPPARDEFEVSVFGPGLGECIVVHLGDNEWCVVDSFISRGASESIAAQYLRGFDNDALNRIRLIVATHWHDDHIRGLSQLVKLVPQASFACSDALNSSQFLTLAAAFSGPFSRSSGTDELGKILGAAEPAIAARPSKMKSPMWAGENRHLLTLPAVPGVRSHPVKIVALSPSDRTKMLALQEFANLTPSVGTSVRRLGRGGENHASVAIWIDTGNEYLILGADLEHVDDHQRGWRAVLNSHDSHRTNQRASFIKVPHHGSITGDAPEVWARMLVTNPVAVVTGYTPSRLPKPSDLKRLAQRTDRLFHTTIASTRTPARDPSVEKMMKMFSKDRKALIGRAGQVRMRWKPQAQFEPVIETFDGAAQFT